MKIFFQANNTKKAPAKRSKRVKQIKILDEDDEDDRELEAAGQSILPNMVEQEVSGVPLLLLIFNVNWFNLFDFFYAFAFR